MYIYTYIPIYSIESGLTLSPNRGWRYTCSADGSTHTESNKLYREVKHRYRPNLSPRQRPTAKSRHDQAALAASAEARGATHRARPRSPSRGLKVNLTFSHSRCEKVRERVPLGPVVGIDVSENVYIHTSTNIPN